ncbi:MAG: D-alanyl-D-alanine carboxypeptidase family protein [Chthoniobacterales bacterium]
MNSSYKSFLTLFGIFLIGTCCTLETLNAADTAPIANAPNIPPELAGIKAESAILIDAKTGKVLFARNENAPRQIASTQKLLTALLVAEEGDLDHTFTIEFPDTQAEPTKLDFKPGEVYSRRALLTVMLVKSTNDAALALARDNAGSVEAFADKMNRRAFVLGATHSHFVNPNGLPSHEQYSTASDLSKIAMAAHENPTLRPIVAMKDVVFQYSTGHLVAFHSTNHVLSKYPFCTGMKTGYTVDAKHCLVLSGEYKDREVIAVVLGCGKHQAPNEATELICYGLGIPFEQPKEVDEDTTPAPAKTKTSGKKKKHHITVHSKNQSS